MMKMNSLFWIRKEIAYIRMQIEEITLLKAFTMTGMPNGHSESASQEERYAEKVEKLNEKLQKKYKQLAVEIERIEAEIEKIEDDELRTIARMRYCNNYSWQAIGEALYMDRTTAYKKLKKYEDGLK